MSKRPQLQPEMYESGELPLPGQTYSHYPEGQEAKDKDFVTRIKHEVALEKRGETPNARYRRFVETGEGLVIEPPEKK